MSHQIAASEANMVIRWADVPDASFWAFFPSEILAIPLDKTPGAGVVPIGAMPVGRVLVRAIPGSYGRNSYLSTDALFSRWDGINGQAWSQDRKSSPIIAPIGSGGPASGGSGRTPNTRAFEEGRDITFMGPREHRYRNPYGITVRGAGLGIKAALNDNFFFSGDHFHSSDHRGPNVPLGSTRIYDFRRARQGEDDTPVGVPDEAMSAGLDTMTIVVPQAGGLAGGDPAENTLAENFSGDTGPGFGAAAFKIDGSRSTDGKLSMIVGYRSYEKFGPFSGGARRGDKHLEGINREGNPVQVAHIHIGAKLTDDSTFYDGRQHIDPVIEPNCGGGGLPVRVWNQFRPTYPDDYFFQTLNGVYDYHTRIPRGMVTIDPTPNKPESDPTPNKQPTDPTPNKPPEDGDPSANKVDDPGDPTPRKPADDPTPNKEPGRPVIDPGRIPGEEDTPRFETPGTPGAAIPELPPDWHGKPSGQATLPPTEPPLDWGPAEIAAPSLEFQPMLGNTAPPTRAVLTPDSLDFEGAPYALSSPEKRAEQEAQTLEQQIENVTIDITGAKTSDHFKAPFTGHFEAYYKHKFPKPQGTGRSLKNFPPSYAKQPKLKLGKTWDKPQMWERGAADGLVLFCGPENKPWRNRHDYAGPVEPFTTVQTLGIYTGHLLGFGKASTDWASIVDGVRIGLNGSNRLNFAFVDANGTPVAGALQVNGVDIGGGSIAFPIQAPDDGVANYAFDAGTTPGSENAGMGFTPGDEGPSLFDIAGTVQLKVSTAGVEIPAKLTVGGFIDPTGIGFSLGAARPAGATTLGNGLWVDNDPSRRLRYYNGATDYFLVQNAGATAADNEIPRFNASGIVIQGSSLLIDDAVVDATYGNLIRQRTLDNPLGQSVALAFDAGAGTGSNGFVVVGAANADGVDLGRTGKTTTVKGSGRVDQMMHFTGAFSGAAGDDVAVGAVSCFRVTSGATLTGMVPAAGGTAVDGQLMVVVNATGGNITLSHDVTSAAANRLFMAGGANLTLASNNAALFRYSTADSRWRHVGEAGGGTGGGIDEGVSAGLNFWGAW